MGIQSKTLEAAFGERLRTKRLEHQLSQEELAHQSGLHRTYISQIERGLKSPSLKTIYALATVLGEDAGVLVAALTKKGERSK